MNQSCQPDAIEQLREDFPGWTFGSAWIMAASGPDRRRFWACRGAVFLSAWSAAELAIEVRKYTFAGEDS